MDSRYSAAAVAETARHSRGPRAGRKHSMRGVAPWSAFPFQRWSRRLHGLRQRTGMRVGQLWLLVALIGLLLALVLLLRRGPSWDGAGDGGVGGAVGDDRTGAAWRRVIERMASPADGSRGPHPVARVFGAVELQRLAKVTVAQFTESTMTSDGAQGVRWGQEALQRLHAHAGQANASFWEAAYEPWAGLDEDADPDAERLDDDDACGALPMYLMPPTTKLFHLQRYVTSMLNIGPRVAGDVGSSGHQRMKAFVARQCRCERRDYATLRTALGLPRAADRDRPIWSLEWDNFTDVGTPLGSREFFNMMATFGGGRRFREVRPPPSRLRSSAAGTRKPPLDDDTRLEHVVVSAHWDSKLFPGISFLGACDSVVPMAYLLQLMKLVASLRRLEDLLIALDDAERVLADPTSRRPRGTSAAVAPPLELFTAREREELAALRVLAQHHFPEVNPRRASAAHVEALLGLADPPRDVSSVSPADVAALRDACGLLEQWREAQAFHPRAGPASGDPDRVVVGLLEQFGLAGLVELASHLPAITIVFFDGEEAFQEWTGDDHTYGSRHLARRWRQESMAPHDGDPERVAPSRFETVDLFVLLDLMGPAGLQFYNYYPSHTSAAYERLRRIEARHRERAYLYELVRPGPVAHPGEGLHATRYGHAYQRFTLFDAPLTAHREHRRWLRGLATAAAQRPPRPTSTYPRVPLRAEKSKLPLAPSRPSAAATPPDHLLLPPLKHNLVFPDTLARPRSTAITVDLERLDHRHGIEDDHIHWLDTKRVLHLIPKPFPISWHTELDDGRDVDLETVVDMWELLSEFFIGLGAPWRHRAGGSP